MKNKEFWKAVANALLAFLGALATALFNRVSVGKM